MVGFAPLMAIDVTVVRDLAALRAIEGEWRALAGAGPGALFRGPDWLLPWWHAYHNTLAAELHVLVGRTNEARHTMSPGRARPRSICSRAPAGRTAPAPRSRAG